MEKKIITLSLNILSKRKKSTGRVQVGSGQVSTQPITELKIRPIYDSAASLTWTKVSFLWQNFLILHLKKKPNSREKERKSDRKRRKERKIIKGRIKGIEDTAIKGERKIASEKLSQKIGRGTLRKGNRGERNRMECNIALV